MHYISSRKGETLSHKEFKKYGEKKLHTSGKLCL